jgi:hypothetical protein
MAKMAAQHNSSQTAMAFWLVLPEVALSGGANELFKPVSCKVKSGEL